MALGATNFSEASSTGIACLTGSFVNAAKCDASPAYAIGFAIESGGIINAKGAMGDPSTTANAITADGIIFK